jgi:hypothetical protein
MVGLAVVGGISTACYSADEHIDLEHFQRPHHDDQKDRLAAWASRFLRTDGASDTRGMLVRTNGHIGQTLLYEVRHEKGTQPALTTLDLRRGTCRDFAFLMIEALRHLGIAARFVSGYLYDASLDDDVGPATGGFRVDTFLAAGQSAGRGLAALRSDQQPAGGGTQLIRVGVARLPTQVAPVAGSWFGDSEAYLGMAVDLRIERKSSAPVDHRPPYAKAEDSCAHLPSLPGSPLTGPAASGMTQSPS